MFVEIIPKSLDFKGEMHLSTGCRVKDQGPSNYFTGSSVDGEGLGCVWVGVSCVSTYLSKK